MSDGSLVIQLEMTEELNINHKVVFIDVPLLLRKTSIALKEPCARWRRGLRIQECCADEAASKPQWHIYD